MSRTKVPLHGELWIDTRAHNDEFSSEIRVDASYISAWKVREGRVIHFYLSGRETLRKLAEAILEAQKSG